jgi:ABC-type multidrug transport system ATPase subunit
MTDSNESTGPEQADAPKRHAVVTKSSFGTQCYVLFKKHFLVAWRGWKSTLVQLFIPVLCIILVQFLTLTANDSFGEYGDTVRNPTPVAVAGLPKCHGKQYGSRCFTLAYASGCNGVGGATTTGVDQVMAQVLPSLGLNPTVCGSSTTQSDPLTMPTDCDVFRVGTPANANPSVAMDDFLFKYPNLTQISVVFGDWKNGIAPTAAAAESACPWANGYVSPTPGVVNNGAKSYVLVYNETIWKTGGCDVAYEGKPEPFRCFDSLKDAVPPLQHAVNKALVRTQLDATFDIKLSQTIFPYPKATNPAVYGSTSFFLFLATVFPLIIFLMAIVSEKEGRLRLGLKSMGLRSFPYWFTWFWWITAFLQVGLLIMYALGAAMQNPFFIENFFFVYFIHFFLFTLSVSALTCLLSTLVQTQRGGMLLGMAIITLFAIFQQIATSVLYGTWVDVPDSIRSVFSLLSPLMFSKGIDTLLTASTSADTGGVQWGDISSSSSIWPLSTCWAWMCVDTVLYALLAFYFDGLIESENGPGQPWYYIFQPSYWCPSASGVVLATEEGEALERHARMADDQDVVAERARACGMVLDSRPESNAQSGFDEDPSKPAILIRGLTKRYSTTSVAGGYLAVDDLNMVIANNSLTALLGPNGAGKTSTLSMLTGTLSATSGTAQIMGYDIGTQMTDIRSIIGVCPQFDIVWKELTGKEHLEMFAALKGIAPEHVEAEANERLREVLLSDIDGNRPVGGYSGGMRRRVSVAAAIIGDPKILYLDECTTGMDPISRKSVWDMILQAKKGRCVVLTTHSMEEADTLSDRIAIMALGRLRCIGTSVRLKNRFGSGYRVTVSFSDDCAADEDVVSGLKNAIASCKDFKACTVSQPLDISSNAVISVGRKKSHLLPPLLEFLETKKDELKINDVQIAMSSLEDVFLRISEEADHAEADKKLAQMKCEGESSEAIEAVRLEMMQRQELHSPSLTPSTSPTLLPPGFRETRCLHCDSQIAICDGSPTVECPNCNHVLDVSALAPVSRRSADGSVSVPAGHRHIQCQSCSGDMLAVVGDDSNVECPHCSAVVNVASRPDVAIATPPSSALTVTVPSAPNDSLPAPVDVPINRGYSFCHQFLTQMKKTAVFQKRQKTQNCCQIVVVALLLVILVIVQLLVVDNFAKEETKEARNQLVVPIDAFIRNDNRWNKDVQYPPKTAYVEADATSNVSFRDLTYSSIDVGFDTTTADANRPLSMKPNPFATTSAFLTGLYDSTYKSEGDKCRRLQDTSCSGTYYGGFDFSAKSAFALNSLELNVYYNISRRDYWGRNPAMIGLAERAAYQFRATQSFTSTQAKSSNIEASFQKFPVHARTDTTDLSLILGTFMFPLLFFIQFPIIVGVLVNDKANRLVEMMKIMGGKLFPYWCSLWVFYFVLYVCSVVLALIVGYAADMRLFTVNGGGLLFILLFLWGIDLVGMAFVFSSFFSSQRAALIVSYLLVFASNIVALIVTPLLDTGSQEAVMNLYSLYPFFAFQRGIYYLSDAADPDSGVPVTWSNIGPGDRYWKFSESLIWCACHMLWLYPLAFYLDQVLRQEFGVKKDPCFCLPCSRHAIEDESVKMEMSAVSVEINQMSGDDQQPPVVSSEAMIRRYDAELLEGAEPVDLLHPDSRLIPQLSHGDCAQERLMAHQSASDPSVLVRCLDLYKMYETKPSPALHRLSLCVRDGELLTILGQNGAGKSTLINLLSGVFVPSSGTAFLDGFSILTEMDSIHASMGSCPQDNLLYEDLTPTEHLLFYGRLRNVPEHLLGRLVREILAAVLLSDRAEHSVKELSGGMKRRLSIAISLLGSPNVCFLDEPTTGLDPATRRKVWDVIHQYREKKAIILTTHSMEEAEALSSRIAIMNRGSLLCIGTSTFLKQRFGSMYRISVSSANGRVDEAASLVNSLFEKGDCVEMVEYRRGNVRQYEIQRDKVNLRKLFDAMATAMSTTSGTPVIEDWALTQPSLEDVFHSLVKE